MELIVKANRIRAEFAAREVLDIDELEIYGYDRIGLVGHNGAGKSTLLKVLAGELALPGTAIQRFGKVALIPQLDAPETMDAEDPALLSRLGVAKLERETMSGGEETRLKLAAALGAGAHLLLADEPTCHLDRAGIDFLIGQLRAFDGALLLISHDRYFLDALVDKIWELREGKITEYWGNYSDYMRQKEEAAQAAQAHFEQTRMERARLERAAEQKRREARAVGKQKGGNKTNEGGRLAHMKSQGSKEKALHNAAKAIEGRLAQLDEDGAPERAHIVRFRQSKALELYNKFPIMGEHINLRFGDKVLLEDAGFVIPLGAKAALTGPNGAGKTSLLRMIYESAPGFRLSPKAVFGYFAQTGYELSGTQTVIEYMQEYSDYPVSEIRGALAAMGIGAMDIQKPLCVLSGGEIIKLLLTKMLLGRYNILLMDEPGNYLDLAGMEALEGMMRGYGGTILFVTHDRRLIENVADLVYEIRDKKLIKQ